MKYKQLERFISFLIVISLSLPLYAEYYEYRDENGVLHFTDDRGGIPETSVDHTVEHKDKYDYMSDDEKKEAKARDQEEAEILKKKRKRETEIYRRKAALAERIKKRKEKLKKMRTKVTISNNQILVPVTLTYGGKSLTATLLLDTGANTTVIYNSVADQLGITSGASGYARVAGGGVIRTKRVKFDSIQAGPKKRSDPMITVMGLKGPVDRFQGLLGLDFLRNYDYSIDYINHYILWKN